MGNHIKGCRCHTCRDAMHTKRARARMKKLIRRIRQDAKTYLRRGQEPPPCVSRGHY